MIVLTQTKRRCLFRVITPGNPCSENKRTGSFCHPGQSSRYRSVRIFQHRRWMFPESEVKYGILVNKFFGSNAPENGKPTRFFAVGSFYGATKCPVWKRRLKGVQNFACVGWGNFGFRPHFVRDMYPNYFRENESSLSRTFFGACCLKMWWNYWFPQKMGIFGFLQSMGLAITWGLSLFWVKFNHL